MTNGHKQIEIKADEPKPPRTFLIFPLSLFFESRRAIALNACRFLLSSYAAAVLSGFLGCIRIYETN